MKKIIRNLFCLLISIFLVVAVATHASSAKAGSSSNDLEEDEEFLEEEFDEEFFEEDEELEDDEEFAELEEELEAEEEEEKKEKVKKEKTKKKEKKKVVKAEEDEEIDFEEDEDIPGFDEEEKEEVKAKETKKEAREKEEGEGEEEKKKEDEIIFQVYEAENRDTLATIANRFYGDPDRWEEIWKYNKYIKDPTTLYKGDSIIVPIKVEEMEKEELTPELEEVKEKLEAFERQAFVAYADVEFEGSIIGQLDGKIMMLVSGNIVFIDIGSDDNVRLDDLYTVYREEGDYIRKVGLLEITRDIEENDATAIIVKCSEPIKIGDFILKRP